MISMYIDYARDIAKELGEKLVVSNRLSAFEKEHGMLWMNPFIVHDVIIELTEIEWRDFLWQAIHHEHLHNLLDREHPETDDAYRFTRDLIFAHTLDMVFAKGIAVIPIDYYIDMHYYKLKLPEEKRDKYYRIMIALCEWDYRKAIPVLTAITEEVNVYELTAEVIMTAYLCAKLDRVSMCRKIFKRVGRRIEKDLVWVYDRSVEIIKSATDPKSVVKSVHRIGEFTIEAIEKLS